MSLYRVFKSELRQEWTARLMKGIQSPLRGEGVDFRVEVGGSESEGSMRLKLTVNDAKPRETRDKGSSRRAGILVFETDPRPTRSIPAITQKPDGDRRHTNLYQCINRFA